MKKEKVIMVYTPNGKAEHPSELYCYDDTDLIRWYKEQKVKGTPIGLVSLGELCESLNRYDEETKEEDIEGLNPMENFFVVVDLANVPDSELEGVTIPR